jgi:hypothetical protein
VIMKANSFLSKWLLRTGGLALVILAPVLSSLADSAGGFVAHEWGTFTSVQGGDGVLLDWRPLETSRLPGFVYDLSKPGFNRIPGAPTLSKSRIITLQRMETPVIYFYTEREMTVDVSVKFPQGTITEWYPQADRVGPARIQPPPIVQTLDTVAHKAGANAQFTFASFLTQHTANDSRIEWRGIQILPAKQHPEAATLLPRDKSGSHYFAARETDAALIRVDSHSLTNPLPEHEKFLFYRGAGSFATPLRATMKSDDAATLTNTGTKPLAHLFVLRVQHGKGQFVHLGRLSTNAEQTATFTAGDEPQEETARKLSEAMVAALTAEGLYPREALAMVNTWKDSWFAEDGVRVLYTLPRGWTDATLPLTFAPAPKELVRVMVGRAEMIPPALVQRLREQLTQAGEGDEAAGEQATAELRKLNRFALPALGLAMKGLHAEATQQGWLLLQNAAKPVNATVAPLAVANQLR